MIIVVVKTIMMIAIAVIARVTNEVNKNNNSKIQENILSIHISYIRYTCRHTSAYIGTYISLYLYRKKYVYIKMHIYT